MAKQRFFANKYTGFLFRVYLSIWDYELRSEILGKNENLQSDLGREKYDETIELLKQESDLEFICMENDVADVLPFVNEALSEHRNKLIREGKI